MKKIMKQQQKMKNDHWRCSNGKEQKRRKETVEHKRCPKSRCSIRRWKQVWKDKHISLFSTYLPCLQELSSSFPQWEISKVLIYLQIYVWQSVVSDRCHTHQLSEWTKLHIHYVHSSFWQSVSKLREKWVERCSPFHTSSIHLHLKQETTSDRSSSLFKKF